MSYLLCGLLIPIITFYPSIVTGINIYRLRSLDNVIATLVFYRNFEVYLRIIILRGSNII